MTAQLLLRDVEVDGTRVDVAVDGGAVAEVARALVPGPRTEVVDGRGGALLPGLWDHHVHLAALAAHRRSVVVGPPEVTDADGLATALGAARPPPGSRWVRGVGYHESVAGDLDRDRLDAVLAEVPVRVQHRSGAMWVLNGAAVQLLGLDADAGAPVERDPTGRATGRLYGADAWLRRRIAEVAPEPPPDLAAVGHELASYGVVGVTDATPVDSAGDLDLLARAAASGALPQRVVAMGGPALADATFPEPLGRGPVKLLLADHSLPGLDALAAWVAAAHASRRPVACHCVTRASLVLALAALEQAGPHPGDRIEHASIVPPEVRADLVRRGVTVVTQPNFVAERGDRYLAEVDPQDRPHLYPCRSLEEAGVPVAGSTDAPFGHPDPWRAVAAAVARRTAAGHDLGAGEAVEPARALGLFLGGPFDPGGRRRAVVAGAPADLCLLEHPLADALAAPAAGAVRATIVGGVVVHHR